jgi:hypothetical protein
MAEDETATPADDALDNASIQSYKDGDRSVTFRSADELSRMAQMYLRRLGKTRTFTRGRPTYMGDLV